MKHRAPRILLLLTLHSSFITSIGCDKSAQSKEEKVKDIQAPTVEIAEPNVPYGVEGISVKDATIKLAGSSEDDRMVVKVKWESSRGAKGVAYTKFEGGEISWEVPEVKLEPGDNRITVTVLDVFGGQRSERERRLYALRNKYKAVPPTTMATVRPKSDERINSMLYPFQIL